MPVTCEARELSLRPVCVICLGWARYAGCTHLQSKDESGRLNHALHHHWWFMWHFVVDVMVYIYSWFAYDVLWNLNLEVLVCTWSGTWSKRNGFILVWLDIIYVVHSFVLDGFICTYIQAYFGAYAWNSQLYCICHSVLRMRCLSHQLHQIWINEVIFLWSLVAVIVNDCINKSLAHCENPRGSLHSLWTVDSPFLLFFPYVIMDDLYNCIDDAIDASTGYLVEEPMARYLGYDGGGVRRMPLYWLWLSNLCYLNMWYILNRLMYLAKPCVVFGRTVSIRRYVCTMSEASKLY